MKNTFGNALTVTLFGESHGPAVGAVIDGLSPGVSIDEEYIRSKMALRKPFGKISTPRHEADEVEFLSGVFNGKTTGTPLTLVIKNKNTKSGDYGEFANKPRPSHADYTGHCKYEGFEDYRGGGHFSGRVTAALVAAGAIMMKALEEKNIYIGTHILRCAGITDRTFEEVNYLDDIKKLAWLHFPVLDENRGAEMISAIESAAAEGDSVGGVLQTVILGLPAGLGEPWFDTVEGMLAQGIFSIPAVKGVAFGAGFGFADLKGSEANDAFCYENGNIVTRTNNNGGINGGITNGMPILFNTAIKPTPSIFKKQQTVNLSRKQNAEIELTGRHDPAIIHRARVVVDAMAALTIADFLVTRFGTDALK